MSKTISYRGPAAAAFVRAQAAEKLTSEYDKFARVATVVYGQVATGTEDGMKAAIFVLNQLLDRGIEKTSASLVGDGKFGLKPKSKPKKRRHE